ncbi:MAG TPA: amidohydrolase family protein [Cyclobacteriaceae bacterium]|nr:amidohydrolase family protein [Cyclobacteriaceae bacterium]
MRRYYDRTLMLFALALFALPRTILAQDEKPVAPVGRSYALTNATIIQAPGRKIEKGTVVMKDGLITAVGTNISIPADAITIKGDSLYVYAGFIDGLSRAGVTKPKEEKQEKPKDPGNPPAERAGITPQNDVRNWLNPNDKSLEELRNLGFTVSQVVPYGNFLPGSGAIVLLGGKSSDDMVLVNNSALYSELSGAMGGVYPGTVMAVMAKWRELYKNASLNKSYAATYASNKNGITRPVSDRILEAFYPVIDQRMPVLFKSERVMETQRVFTLKNDLGFKLTIADVKEGWPIINKIKSSDARVFLSLDLPDDAKKDDKKDDKKGAKKDSTKTDAKKSDVKKEKTSFDLEKESLEKRKKESIGLYTSQASAFNKAGIEFGFSAASAKTKDIQANLRRMITAGLSEDAALAALTTSPAKLLNLSDRLGTVDKGMMANLVVSDKPYFNEKAKVRYVFVDGTLYKIEAPKDAKKTDAKPAVARGTWTYTTKTSQGSGGGKIVIKEDNGTYSGKITPSAGKDADLKSVIVDGASLSFSYDSNSGGKVDVSVKIEGDSFDGKVSAGQDGNYSIKATRDPKSN